MSPSLFSVATTDTWQVCINCIRETQWPRMCKAPLLHTWRFLTLSLCSAEQMPTLLSVLPSKSGFVDSGSFALLSSGWSASSLKREIPTQAHHTRWSLVTPAWKGMVTRSSSQATLSLYLPSFLWNGRTIPSASLFVHEQYTSTCGVLPQP